MHLTPDILRGAYDFLRTTPPFCFRPWRLPAGDKVQFIIEWNRRRAGSHTTIKWVREKEHIIGVSAKLVGFTAPLLEIMAHEMVHAVQAEYGLGTPGAEHNADFIKRSHIVCRYHGWDPKGFYC